VRQETVKVTNGQMCIKNLTTVENKVNVEHSCRKLSKYALRYAKGQTDI
jgi:hypothetical protein